MLVSVGHDPFGQCGQDVGDVRERRDAACEHDIPGFGARAVFRHQCETGSRPLERGHMPGFHFRHITLLEPAGIGVEHVQAHGQTFVLIGKALRLAIILQCGRGHGAGKAGGETVGFEQHVLRHVIAPGVQRLAENAEGDAQFFQVGGQRKAVRPGTDDGDVAGVCHSRRLQSFKQGKCIKFGP